MERPHRPRPARLGFTLVELLIAILIIASLLALLIPTVAAAFRKAKEAAVSAELNNLATALASFKNTYNDYPPSRVLLCEQGYTNFLNGTSGSTIKPGDTIPSTGDNKVSDMTYAQLAQRSALYMKRFWSRCNFNDNLGSTLGQFNDFNGDRMASVDPIILNGSECLAFFLGGIPLHSGSVVIGVSGFSKSPKFPFVDNGSYNNIQLAPNRTVPNYEFNVGRLIDQDGDLIPSYIDPIDVSQGNRRAYAYFASYGSNAYDPNDVNGFGHNNSVNQNLGASGISNFEEEDSSDLTSTTPIFVERGFTVSFPPSSVVSPAPNPYTSGAPISTSPSWINANSFQIICAGQDRQFGLGGTYLQNNAGSNGSLPISPLTSSSGPSDAGNVNNDTNRLRESDNVTNFASGRLQ